jgi:hypothetical protein
MRSVTHTPETSRIKLTNINVSQSIIIIVIINSDRFYR